MWVTFGKCIFVQGVQCPWCLNSPFAQKHSKQFARPSTKPKRSQVEFCHKRTVLSCVNKEYIISLDIYSGFQLSVIVNRDLLESWIVSNSVGNCVVIWITIVKPVVRPQSLLWIVSWPISPIYIYIYHWQIPAPSVWCVLPSGNPCSRFLLFWGGNMPALSAWCILPSGNPTSRLWFVFEV